jgi:hypothetical protein
MAAGSVRVCVRACVRACVCACVRACVLACLLANSAQVSVGLEPRHTIGALRLKLATKFKCPVQQFMLIHHVRAGAFAIVCPPPSPRVRASVLTAPPARCRRSRTAASRPRWCCCPPPSISRRSAIHYTSASGSRFARSTRPSRTREGA